jgi:hypothetical protein
VLRLFLSLLILCGLGAGRLFAQRVEFPSAVPNFTPTPQPALSTFDPYGNPLLGTPPADVPYNVAPPLNSYPPPITPPVTPPATSGPIGPAPTVATPGSPTLGNSTYPSGVPFQWESGAYQYQNSDGTVVRLQRLLQQIGFEHTWIWGDQGIEELGINRTELTATFGVPIFYNPNTPLLITPGFAFNWLEGPLTSPANDMADLPPRVYDAYLDAAWYPQLTDWLGADLGLRTGVWTDFHELNSDSIRILGRGLGVLSLSPQFDFLAGVWYLDRNDVKLLPAGGLHWRPNPEVDAYLVFPNPKVRKRSISFGSSQFWIYVSGEYGGGRWTIERLGGIGDDIDYNDIRAIFGIEWETQTQAHGHVEVGYVFDRELLYDKTMMPAKLKLDDSVMVRAGLNF